MWCSTLIPSLSLSCVSHLLKGVVPSLVAGQQKDADEDGGEGREDAEDQAVRAEVGDSYVHAVFAGVLENVVECCACGHVSRTEEAFFDLSLPIEPPRPPPVDAVKAKPKSTPQRDKAIKKTVAKEGTEVEQAAHDKSEREREAKEEEERQHLLLLEEVTRGNVELHIPARRRKQQPSTLRKKVLSKAQKKKLNKRRGAATPSPSAHEEGGEAGAEEESEEEEAATEREDAAALQVHPEDEEKVATVEEPTIAEEPRVLPVSPSEAPPQETKEEPAPDPREESAGTPQPSPADDAERPAQEGDASVEDLAQDVEQLSLDTSTVSTASSSSTASRPSLSSSASSPTAARPSRLAGACSLEDCLQSFFDAELLTGSNAFRCQSCASLASLSSSHSSLSLKRDATRRYSLRSLPRVLTIHLKRFAASASGRAVEKLNKKVLFPLTVSLLPFLSSQAPRGADPLGASYTLYGVVSHSGNMSGGHYVAYVQRGGVWWHANDAHVTEVTADNVLNVQAYLLFYLRHDP